jgi:hypothetical protein
LCTGSVEQPSNLAALLVLAGTSALATMLAAIPLVFLINPVLGTPFRVLFSEVVGSLLHKRAVLVSSGRKSAKKDYE